MNEKEKLHKKSRKFPYDVKIKKLYRDTVKKLKTTVRKAKNSYYFSEFEKFGQNQSKQWQFVNNLIGKNKKKIALPIYSDASKLANDFNKFFINCTNSVLNVCEDFHFPNYQSLGSFCLFETNYNEVKSA